MINHFVRYFALHDNLIIKVVAINIESYLLVVLKTTDFLLTSAPSSAQASIVLK